jgi:hypothetical protein
VSKFKPDLFINLKNKGFGIESPVDLISDKPETPKQQADVSKVITALAEYGASLDEQNARLYTYAKLATRLTNDIYNEQHLTNVFFEFLSQTIKKLHPSADLQKLYEATEQVEEELEKVLKTLDKKENTLIIPVLAGMLEELL